MKTPLFPTVTVSLAGFVMMEGGETSGGDGSGGAGVGDGGAGAGGAGEEGGIVFTLPPTFAQPDTNSAGKTKSVRRCKIPAQ